MLYIAPQEKRVQYLLGKLYSVEGKTALAKQAFAKFSELEAAEQDRSRMGGQPYMQRPNEQHWDRDAIQSE